MKQLTSGVHLNTFFKSYTFIQDFIITIHNNKGFTILDIRLFNLKKEILKRYSPSDLRYYIMEILVIILKEDDYNLNLITVCFYDGLKAPVTHNLGGFDSVRTSVRSV